MPPSFFRHTPTERAMLLAMLAVRFTRLILFCRFMPFAAPPRCSFFRRRLMFADIYCRRLSPRRYFEFTPFCRKMPRLLSAACHMLRHFAFEQMLTPRPPLMIFMMLIFAIMPDARGCRASGKRA